MLIFIILFFYIAIPTLLLSFLQLFLCRKDIKWGRILPIFFAVASVLFTLFVLLFCVNAVGVGTGHGHHGGARVLMLAALAALVVLNIPTLVFYLIYRAEQKKLARDDLDRMKIDDLE